MSKCCKNKCWMKFLPHNWLCLKGLYVVFIVLFYLALVLAIFTTFQIVRHPLFSSGELWGTLIMAVGQVLGLALMSLTTAKVLKALGKIKQAVAPCCCHEEKETQKEEAK